MSVLFENPFSGLYGSALSEESIFSYWCSPFRYDFAGIKEDDIYLEKTNIFFFGGRSTGKTMLLRYWSCDVQVLVARENNTSFLNQILKNKGVGFYIRIDQPTINNFEGKELSIRQWSALFIHYFEMHVARKILEFLNLLKEEGSCENEINNKLIWEICDLIGYPQTDHLLDIISHLDKRIKFVDDFRGELPLFEQPFTKDGKIFTSKSLSFGISTLISKFIGTFKDLNFVICVDEYENFLAYQQLCINAIMKAFTEKIKFRIGSRLEGFKTYKVGHGEDFLMEKREYKSVELEKIMNKTEDYHKFLIDVAEKRLASSEVLKERGLTNIRSILGLRENLEEEARELVKNRENVAYEYFLKQTGLPKTELDKVKFPENPLMELMNFIWLSKGVSAQDTFQAMTDYLQKNQTALGKKYNNDYVNKYKLSLMFVLCSIFRTNKKYYSFNTFAFLSSGMVGHFIELCRVAFVNAGWSEYRTLFEEGRINIEHQNDAAYEVSNTAKKQISRIEKYGGRLSLFVENLGNIFKRYHQDNRMTYPETNQFALNIDFLQDEDLQEAIRSAIKWSVILRKPALQLSGPGENLQELYTLNRIYSPAFRISYRTRGGKSVPLNEELTFQLMSSKISDFSPYMPSRTKPKSDKMPRLFE